MCVYRRLHDNTCKAKIYILNALLKKIQNTLIFVAKANGMPSPNCTFSRILEHFEAPYYSEVKSETPQFKMYGHFC